MTPKITPLAIETHALTRRYAGVDVVREVTLRVPVGRKVALVGSNGAGKTTLLSVLSTLVQPTSGEAWIAGCPLSERSAARGAGEQLGAEFLLQPRQAATDHRL